MKKVLLVASVTSHINTFHIPYLKYFKEQGYEVHVASKGTQNIEYCDKHFNLEFERFPIKFNNIKAYKQLSEIINKEKYEIIHCHTPTASVITRLASRRTRKINHTKVIYTAHGFHFYKGAPIKNWVIYYPIEKLCAHCTDCLITITKEDYDFAKKHLKSCPKIEHINGIGMNSTRLNKTLSNEEKQEIRRKLGIKGDEIVFSYIAELNNNKNQILLIKTIKELKQEIPNIKLLLIGDGPLKDKYQEYIENNNLTDNVILLGKRKDINDLLSITDIYLASSKREGLPVNVMEAMYKGLPIIATDNRGHRELINDSENGYIIKDYVQVKDKIKNLIQDKESAKIMGNKSQEKITKYEVENVLKNMERIYACKHKEEN